MRFDVLTLFPEIFESYLGQSLLNLAIQKGLVEVNTWNFRDWTQDKRRSVDDKPFGGGPGMLIMCEPVFDCVESVQKEAEEPGQLIMLNPGGRRLDHSLVQELGYVAEAVGALNQSYNFRGIDASLEGSGSHATCSGSGFNDEADDCDCKGIALVSVCGKDDPSALNRAEGN